MTNGNNSKLGAMSPWIRHAIQGVGIGGGGMIAIEAIKELGKHPELLPQLTSGVIPYICFAIVALVIVDRRLGTFSEMHAKGVAAQEMLAANVGALVMKDDQRAREQDILLDHLARNSEETLSLVKQTRAICPTCVQRGQEIRT
jgi:hypothetical protein